MPNQIPYNYFQNTPIPDFLEINKNYPNQINNTNIESNIMYKLNEIDKRLTNIENKLNELTNKENKYYDYNYKTSMHMM